MCGILGFAGPNPPDDALAARLRDLMTARGPDGAGLWRGPGIALAHRRLAILDPTPSGAQPMTLPDGSAIVYNGELYNDADVRAVLAQDGARFHTSCDTETVLLAMQRWGGEQALLRLRGMYALAYFDAPRRRLTLARDPLGIKPLYYRLGPLNTAGPASLLFASDPRAILLHPGITPRPDLTTVSAYLTTIRTTLGGRTLFEGVRTLLPGEAVTFDLSGNEPLLTSRRQTPINHDSSASASPVDIREAIEDSILRHLRSDVPTCCLLSGGLDSSIISLVAGRRNADLHTYCSGAPAAAPIDGTPQSDDFAFARVMASHLGTRHTEVPVTRGIFAQQWPSMIDALGVPLSTPNEVAIHEVAHRIRADGRMVTLSGEGADELFGGYDGPLTDAVAFLASNPKPSDSATAQLLLDSAAWLPTTAKPAILNPDFWRAVEGDAALCGTYMDEFADVRAERDDEPLQAHLRFQRRINLTGLLARLDTATMLAGVEGRTPFADSIIAGLAESLPMSAKFAMRSAAAPARMKIVLREAFGPDLPPHVASRPKASFPLPFQDWIEDNAQALSQSSLARELFSPHAIAAIAARPRQHWRFAWPMINIALWARRWWG